MTSAEDAARGQLAESLHDRFGERFHIPAHIGAPAGLAGIAAHRTCRQFRGTRLDPALMKLLAATALSSPSKSDLQQARVAANTSGLVVRNPDPLEPAGRGAVFP